MTSHGECIHQPYSHWPSFSTKDFGMAAPCRVQCLERPDWEVSSPYVVGYQPPYFSWHYHADILGCVLSCYGKLQLKDPGPAWNGMEPQQMA